MSTFLWIISVGIGLLLLWAVISNTLAVIQARPIKHFLLGVGEAAPFHSSGNPVTRYIYFEDTSVGGTAVANENGIHLRSAFSFEALLPWHVFSAIHITEIDGNLVANCWISSGDSIDRRLSVPWRREFMAAVPESVDVKAKQG